MTSQTSTRRAVLHSFSVRTLIQTGYWLLYGMLLLVLFFVMTTFQRPPMSLPYWCRIMAGFAVIPGFIGFYSFYFLLFPIYLRTRKWLHLILLAVAVALFAALAGILALVFLVNAGFWVNDGIFGVAVMAVPLAFIASVNGSIGFVVKGFESWFQDLKLKEELSRKNYEMELALIKSQLDPHFLFNTINNIDILIEKDSVRASAYLNKLSDMMRFMLYETKSSRIPLAEELAYIEKYMILQKIRTSNERAVEYIVQGDPGLKVIAPMLFIPFIENAFKHTDLKVPGAVRVCFEIGDRDIVFKCENLLAANTQRGNRPGGLGKQLIEKRLALLYPGRYDLETHSGDGYYSVKLCVEI